jgi:hypothetical protein
LFAFFEEEEEKCFYDSKIVGSSSAYFCSKSCFFETFCWAAVWGIFLFFLDIFCKCTSFDQVFYDQFFTSFHAKKVKHREREREMQITLL